MRKSIFYSLFGLGKVLRGNRAKLEAETIVLMDEGVPASMTLHGFSGMGRFASCRKSFFAGALVLTKTRFYGNAHLNVILNIPLQDPHIRKIDVSAEAGECLDIHFEAPDFIPAKGQVHLRFKTPQARQFLEALQPFLAPPDPLPDPGPMASQ